MKKGNCLYEGKAKRVFSIPDFPDRVWVEFKNSLTAFNGEKKLDLSGKGALNAKITGTIFNFLKSKGVKNHLLEVVSDTEMICEKVQIIPLEVVVRNVLAGSTAKKFKIEEGKILSRPLVELYFKDDALGDPFINDEQALMIGAVNNLSEIETLKQKALEVNQHIQPLFQKAGLRLIDFKLEFGWSKSKEILLADEITPDTCRLWDQNSGEKLDKDRFRRDLGGVLEAYEEVYKRLQDLKI
jgi:phosphoribosylaminoimidazole-succinocarboxamide synthase